MANILIVEDESNIARGLLFNLEAEGHRVLWVDNATQALHLLLDPQASFELVLLDVMMEGMDGITMCRRLREAQNYVPVLMLTARERVADRVEGLEAGADDYLTKPFSLQELLARVAGLLRRQKWQAGEDPTPRVDQDILQFGGNRVNCRTFEAVCRDGTVKLTAMELGLIRYMFGRAGEVVSRQELLENVWGMRATIETRTVDNFIVRMRRLFEEDARNPTHFISVRGVGYQFKLDS